MSPRPWIGVAVSQFNPEVTERLLTSCLKVLSAAGYGKDALRVMRVPGGFELPWAVQELCLARGCQAVIALGCILKGSTTQNEHIARSTIQHLHSVSLKTRIPVLLGVITPKDEAQALARCKGRLDRGREAAEAALAMVRLRGEI